MAEYQNKKLGTVPSNLVKEIMDEVDDSAKLPPYIKHGEHSKHYQVYQDYQVYHKHYSKTESSLDDFLDNNNSSAFFNTSSQPTTRPSNLVKEIMNEADDSSKQTTEEQNLSTAPSFTSTTK